MKPRPPRQRYGPAVVLGPDGVPRIVTVPIGPRTYGRIKVTPENIAASQSRPGDFVSTAAAGRRGKKK
jgi:hypothetical protein